MLLSAEQGLGDTLHFVRYAPMVAARGGNVILHCQEALASLLGRIEGIGATVASGGDVPPHDVHVPLLSLPRIIGTTMEDIPENVPYIQPLPGKTDGWKASLQMHSGVKVGLVWAGDPKHANDRNRSMPAATLRPLFDVPNVQFFSLQLGERGEDANRFPAGAVIDLSPQIASFEDTAAILAHLDLVITVDTAVCHLAGGMARPVWVLLAVAHDWRWFDGRDDSPWYPTMRLFRQKCAGDWTEVIGRVASALVHRIGKDTGR